MKNKLRIIKRKVLIYTSRLYVILYGLFHKTEKKILFDSFVGKQYSDNSRAISEKIHELYPDYRIVWYIIDKEKCDKILPEYVKIISSKLNFYKELATCCSYVTNENMEPDKYKKKGQFFVQNWHGDIGPKKVLYSAYDDINKKRPIPVTDNNVTNICIAGSDFGENVYRKAFRYNGEVLKIGSPRNDKLINQDKNEINKIKKILNIDSKTKVLLYAPTFRDYNIGKSQNIDIDLKSVVSRLTSKGEKWICLVRAHSILKGFHYVKSDEIIDVTPYPDMADLLLISDMLITDYSSCAFDFIIKEKPVILAVFDIDNYKKNCRGLNFLMDEVGLLTAKNQKELVYIIDNTSDDDYKKTCIKVKKRFNMITNGNASEIIAKRINEFYKKNFE